VADFYPVRIYFLIDVNILSGQISDSVGNMILKGGIKKGLRLYRLNTRINDSF